MSKKKGSTTSTTMPDAQTQAYGQQVWDAANQAGASPGAPVNPLTGEAVAGFQGMQRAGNLGLGAMSGDPAAMQKFMDPYQSGVIDQLNNQYGMQRAQTSSDINAQATAAHAFGGSRHGVAEGMALGELGRAQGQQVAGLLDTGFNNGMNRAGQMANLGFGASGALGGMGEYMRNVDMQNDPAMRKYMALSSAFGMMPHGSTTTGTSQNGSNPITGALGGMAAGSQFGPWGTVAGGIGGLFGL